jgi:nucleoside-diphosphate kinase
MVSIVVILKPDGVERGLDTAVRAAYGNAGFQLRDTIEFNGWEVMWIIKQHYEEHNGKEYYDALITSMAVGRLRVYKFETAAGDETSAAEVIAKGRKVCLAMRGLFSLGNPNNTVHASDSPDAAKREVDLWF